MGGEFRRFWIDHSEPVAGVILLSLEGDLSPPGLSDVENLVLGLVQQGYRRWVIDLSNLKHISSSGVSCLVAMADSQRHAAVRLAIAAPPKNVRAVVEMLGVGTVLPIFATTAEAIRHGNSP